MTDFKRLLDEESTDATDADLIRFARREQPSPEGRAKILEALAARGLIAGSAGGAAIQPGSETSAAGAPSQAPAAVHGLVPLKWGLLTIAAVGLPVLAWLAFRGAEEATTLESRQTTPAVQESVIPAATTEKFGSKPASSEVVRVEDLPVLRSATPTKAAPSASSGSSLAEEVKALGRAKAALSAGNAGQALRELDAHAVEFPNGKLRQEATVTRIEALIASGDRASAERLGQRFLAHGDKSPYAARVRSLIGE